MKNICSTLIMAVAASVSYAQQSPTPMIKALPLQLNNSRPKLIGTNHYGKVYAMPTDNMPCLVPNASLVAPMPVATIQPLTPMPNPFQPNADQLVPDTISPIKPVPMPGPQYQLKREPLRNKSLPHQ